MSLSVEIDQVNFNQRGYSVAFDADKYVDLLTLAAGGRELITPPAVIVKPIYYLGLNQRQRLQAERAYLHSDDPTDMLRDGQFGHYGVGSNEITVKLNEDEKHANNSLYHETKHWAEDMVFGTLKADMEAAFIKGSLANQYGEKGQQSMIRLLLHQHRYRNTPHEKRARAFASDRQVKALVGTIITIDRL